jgi:DNA adenine methylase
MTFLKWVGGKSQLLPELIKLLPQNYTNYYEPFLGGGAMFFHLAPKLESAYLSDINAELINTYINVKSNVYELIDILNQIESNYLNLSDDNRKNKYYELREEYNSSELNIKKAALFITLNKLCFNGLYRVNSNNKFNVPHGSYKNPNICNKEKLIQASGLLSIATIENKRYDSVMPLSNSFMYLDPPYRPLTKTASFNSYSNDSFDDNAQIKLMDYCSKLKINFMLSNSDPKNIDVNDNFFDDLYSQFKITRLLARRMINSKANNRGSINEIVIRNY